MNDRPHILIVDDVTENIQVAMNILQEDNYDFSFAISGEEALDLAQNSDSSFDLILLDIMMPGVDGFEVCDKLKNDPLLRDVPIVFLTAKIDIEAISKAFRLGAADYITKPFHADELLARVRNHIRLYRANWLLKLHNLDLEAKIEFNEKRLLTELEDYQREMIYILTELMESTSDETGKHIRRVAETSALLAKYHPSLDEQDEMVLMCASPMHDIGKMMVPQEILNKPGKYTEEEFEVMKKHTSYAYKMLRGSHRRLVKAAATIAYEHHEKWDGTGYPNNLRGTDIHIYGRIVALADVFDALTHARCYKSAWPISKVVDYIRQHSGTQFDPQLVDIFLDHLDEFKKICEES